MNSPDREKELDHLNHFARKVALDLMARVRRQKEALDKKDENQVYNFMIKSFQKHHKLIRKTVDKMKSDDAGDLEKH